MDDDYLVGGSAEECRQLDRTAIEEFGIPGLLLMEHASIGAAQFAAKQLAALRPDGPRHPRRALAESSVLLVCGPGNNGGDGFAMARHLDNLGVRVSLWELVDPAGCDATSDAGHNRAIAASLGLALIPAWDSLPPAPVPPPDIIVDAVFGTGLSRPPTGQFQDAIRFMNDHPAPVLAVDVPSGLDTDLGTPLEQAVEARWTVTFGLMKRGFLRPGAARFTGPVFCVPIGVPRRLLPPGAPIFPPEAVPFPADPRASLERASRENGDKRSKGTSSA